MRIVGISGSLRRASWNSLLLRIAAARAPGEMSIDVASIRDIPLYDGDVEAGTGIPPVVESLKERIAAADGLLIVTPEYNHSLPGVAKNAVDWLSRPPRDIRRVFGMLPVAVIGTTPGRGGTQLSQAAWLPVLRALGTRPFFGRILGVPHAAKVFESETITDEDTQDRLDRFLADFAAFVASTPRQSR